MHYNFSYTTHAQERIQQRLIDQYRLEEQLRSIPFDTERHICFRWNVPKTNLFAVFTDQVIIRRMPRKVAYRERRENQRLIVIVSIRYLSGGKT